MSLWRRIRAEAAGAWRSVGYDLGRRSQPPAMTDRADVTSTGMNTFPGAMVDLPSSPLRTDAAPPRRFVAVTVFCLLALLGAGGSYLVATSIFGSPRGVVPEQAPPKAATADLAAGPGVADIGTEAPTRPAVTTTAAGRSAAPVTTATRGPAPRSAFGSRDGSPTGSRAGSDSEAATAGPAAPATARHPRPATVAPEKTKAAAPPCDCVTPPVPTPTEPSGTPSASPSVQPSGNTDNSPDPSASAQPGGSASPSASDRRDGRRHRH